MELDWEATKGGLPFTTVMLLRDMTYPIGFQKYPANGSMVTDSQQVGGSDTAIHSGTMNLLSLAPVQKGNAKYCNSSLEEGLKEAYAGQSVGDILDPAVHKRCAKES